MTEHDRDPDVRGFRTAVAAMLRLALPVVVVQIGLMLMGVVDSMMVGRVSAEALAAVALGNVYFFAAAIFGFGTLLALDPVVAQAVGASDDLAVSRGLQRGLVLATILTLPVSCLLVPAEPLLLLLQQPEGVARVSADYARVSIAGVLPFFLFVVYRQTLQAMHHVAAIVWTIVIANILNVGFNWVFVFGHLGFPAMGAVGASWATVLSRWLLVLGVLLFGWRHLRAHHRPWRREAFDLQALKRMVMLGAPIGAAMQLEFGIFGAVGVLMGWIGPVAMAGHQVALNLASLTFMVPLGVSGAAAVLVGNAVGRVDDAAARSSAGAALLMGTAFMVVSATVMVAVPGWLSRAYTDQAEIIAVAVTLIPLAGLFQVFDGIQVSCVAILRGVGDTRTPMIVAMVGFWLVGLPIAWFLGLRLEMGPPGLWWGLVAGLAAVAVILLLRVRIRLSGHIDRVVIDHATA